MRTIPRSSIARSIPGGGPLLKIHSAAQPFVRLWPFLAALFISTASLHAAVSGELDPTFTTRSGPNNDVYDLAVQNDGRIVVAGNFTVFGVSPRLTVRNRIARIHPDSTLDLSFLNSLAGANDAVRTVLLDADKILIGGAFTTVNGASRRRIARLNADGSLDSTFVPGTGADGPIFTMAIYSDRLTRSFERSIALQRHLIVAGSFSTFNGAARSGIARLSIDGALSSTFNPRFTFGIGPTEQAPTLRAIALTSTRQIYVGGNFTHINGSPRFFLARLNSDGTTDTSFTPSSAINSEVYAISLQSDEKILVGGNFQQGIYRLNSNGTIDSTFDAGSGTADRVRSIRLQPDGRIIVGGDFQRVRDLPRNYLVRLNANGSVDSSFNPGSGPNAPVHTIDLQPDSKILLGGSFTLFDGTERTRLARLLGEIPPVITAQPTNQTVTAGNSASFSIQASGTSLNYQWYASGSPLAGQTAPILQITNLQWNNTFYAVASNAAGSAQSQPASLTVLYLPGQEMKPPPGATPNTAPTVEPPDAAFWSLTSNKLYATRGGPVRVTWVGSPASITVSATIESIPAQEFVLGQMIPPPSSADTNSPAGPEINPPDAAFWHPPSKRLFATAPASYTITWKNSAGAPIAVGAQNSWPTNAILYQVHVANTPPVILTNGSNFTWTRLLAQDPGTGSDPLAVEKSQFHAPNPGRSLLLLSSDNPQMAPIYFQFVKTISWSDPAYLTDAVPATIGQPILDSNGLHDPALGGPALPNPLSRYCAATNYYNPLNRSGPIIPVNRDDPTSAADDFVIVYYQKGSRLIDPTTGNPTASNIGWPQNPVRYDCRWPDNPPLIIIASQQGTGEIDPALFLNWDLYIQNNPSLPGFNPNDEHALRRSLRNGEAVFALRDDLASPATSDPFVLITYLDAQDNRSPKIKVFKVIAEQEPFFFSYPVRAGTLLPPPFPLNTLSRCADSHGFAGPFWRDRKLEFWAKAAGDSGGPADVILRFFYPVQPGFFFPDAVIPPGTPVPWLDRRTSTTIGIPTNVRFIATWPTAPELRVGETLLKPKFGLPDIISQTSTEIIYQQSLALGQGPSAHLIDPTRIREVDLAQLPPDVAAAPEGDKVYFDSLPPQLRRRVWFDPINKKLRFKGEFIEPVAGEYYLLLNVLSPREKLILLSLSQDPAFATAINTLAARAAAPIEIPPQSTGFDKQALTAGAAQSTGYVTIAFNNNTNLNQPPDPISLQIIKVSCPLYRGELKVIPPDSPFDERITLRHSGDFAGHPDNYIFEWRTLPPQDGGPPARPPANWSPVTANPPTGQGAVDFTIEGPGLLTLSDNYFICRYRSTQPSPPCGSDWSDWTAPMLAEGWIKRVLAGINPFEQRLKGYQDQTVNTIVSMISQAGPRPVGATPLNAQAANQAGLIETYQTVLNRGIQLSIEGNPPINYAPANDALLLAASRIADLYLLLGNEAFADASDPTIAFGTDDRTYGAEATSIHCFMNQSASLLDEELSLLRGRDDKLQPGVRHYPVYNRLYWNFTRDLNGGEVAYALNYNIRNENGDVTGTINEADAKRLFPQGHGDAWGHYTMALKGYYQLLRNPQFDWIPRIEAVLLGGVPVSVDYLDERKFAKAAAARAQAGAEIVNLTYRAAYVEDPDGQWQGYRDPDSNRAWGLSEWGARAGQAALFDWAAGNALLPALDPDPAHTGIQKVDRTTVTELRDVAAAFLNIQDQVDKADAGLNPLGLAKNVVPFDLDPVLVSQNRTHFEQIYDRAVRALNNAVAVFNHANNSSQLLRRQADTVADFQQHVIEREADFKNRLIEVFGYPYGDDISPAGTYPEGYDGPDLYHYMYADRSQITGEPPPRIQPLTLSAREIEIGPDGRLSQVLRPITFHIPTDGFGVVKPAHWTKPRRAPGEIQLAHSDLLQTKARLDRSLAEYENLLNEIDAQAELLERQHNLHSLEILVLNSATREQSSLNRTIRRARSQQLKFRGLASLANTIANAVAEHLPKSSGPMSFDATSIARGAILLTGGVLSGIMNQNAERELLAELEHEHTKELVQSQTNIRLTTLRQQESILNRLAELERFVRQEALARLEIYSLQEALQQSSGRYMAALANGQRLLEDRLRFRQQTAAQIQAYRYKDMAFRIFRNDALQKYRAQFDLAARYVYLAATAYDYETNLREGDPRGPGQRFMTEIIRTRAIGLIQDGIPQTGSGQGDAGLADPMARMFLNWDLVLKGQLGFNNPDTETGRFSLRSELFRIRPGTAGNATWRAALSQHVVTNILDLPEFKRYCVAFSPANPLEPGIVIPFPTTINFGQNFFGWPAGGGDNSYDSTHYATKIRSVGVWFGNYNNLGGGMANTPRVYLVPVGSDVLRSPTRPAGVTREWRILDQLLPVPFPISAAALGSRSWIPMVDTFSEPFGELRQFASFRAFHDSGNFNPAETISNSRLIGRSVWNTRWLLLIPAGTLHSDRQEGLNRFIHGALVNGQRDGNGVTDIKLFFQTYSYAAN